MPSGSDDNVVVAFLFAAVGGVLMGSFLVPFKAKSVLAARVNPLILQCYKSFWVFVFGCMFVFVNLIRDKPWYVFSYWPMLGAAAWVMCGVCNLAAVPRIGVGMAMVLATGSSALLQFLIGQMVGEEMKRHGAPGHEYVLAPWYLAAVMLGMVGLVLSPILGRIGDMKEKVDLPIVKPTGSSSNSRKVDDLTPAEQLLTGISLAVMAGVLAALHMTAITIGKKVEKLGCNQVSANERTQCLADCSNAFDPFGSYMVSFGIGTGCVTALYVGLFAAQQTASGHEMPSIHFNTLKILGSIGGWCWFCGNVFQSAAVDTGGSSVMGPANSAITMITSGAWSLLYYREVKDNVRIVSWVLCAAWTVTFAIRLGHEKG